MLDRNKSISPETVRLQAILDSAVDAIITIDEQGVIESVNPATKTLFQYSVEELIGENVSRLMPSPFREQHPSYLTNYLQSGVPKIIGFGREVVGQRKDGTTFPIHLGVSEITFDGRRIFTGIVRDITDLKEAEKKLEELNSQLEERVRRRTEQLREMQAELVAKEKLATLGQVSGGIAHEIRNPLSAVKSSAYYLLNAKTPSEDKMREHLQRIDRQVTLIDNAITALSDVAKLPDPTVAPVVARAILMDVVGEISMPAKISVALDMPDNLAPMLADENQIPIVFRNLLRNARDAMPNGGVIKVAARQVGDRIIVSVHDTGSGIASRDLARIMEPLYSTKVRGMGLGLAICKAIVEKNGGLLAIQSEVGQGSTFTVELPAGTN
jgi:two-component system sensor kinase FixL